MAWLRFFVAATAFVLSACGGDSKDPDPQPRPQPVANVRVSPNAGTLAPGSTLQLAAAVTDAAGLPLVGKQPVWASLQPNFATVDANGLVTGVATGTANVTATVDGRSGTATLAVAPPVSQRCDAVTPIAVGQLVVGDISLLDCQLVDTSYADKFVLTLTETTPIRISLSSGSFDAYLILQNGTTSAVITTNDDGNGGQNARIEQVLSAGRYVIVANTFDPGQTGGYQLSVVRGSGVCIGATPAVIPATINGTLTAAACVLGDSTYADRYALTVATTTVLTASMRSTIVDAFIFLESTSGELIARDNNSLPGGNARIVTSLAPGRYVLSANAVTARDTGAYTLTLAGTIDPCGADRVLTAGTPAIDTLSASSCALNDGSFAKRFRFNVATAGPVRLDMSSTALDPYLIVQRVGESATLFEDDDSGPGLDAQILQTFQPGDYIVTANTASSGQTGIFQLTASGTAPAGIAITVTPTTVALAPGATQQLTATVTGSANTSVLWRSGAPTIATVSSTGLVRAITAGDAVITATASADASKTAQSAISVGALGLLNLDVPLVYLTQSVQTQDSRVPLVANRATLARVFVRGSTSGIGITTVRLRIYSGGAVIGTLTGTATAATATDESCCAANITIPQGMLRDGISIVADVDPANAIAESNEGDNAWPLTGESKAIRLVSVPTVTVQLVPIQHRTGGLTGPRNTDIAALLPRMFPVAQFNPVVHADYVTDLSPLTDATSWIGMLREMETLRALEGSTAYYYGVLNQRAAPGIVGIATISGFAGVGVSAPDNKATETFTHEFGHSFGRRHAPSPTCGAPAGVDQNYPQADGKLGAFGFDILRNVMIPASTGDIMGYCDDTWTSPYTYLGVLSYLRSGAITTTQTVASQPMPVLLINGSLLDGEVAVDPIFADKSRTTLAVSNGRFVAEGLGSDGRVLFSHRFNGRDVADGNVIAQTFSIAVPYDATVSGPVARVTVREAFGGTRAAVRVRTGTYVGAPNGVNLRVDADPQLSANAVGAGRLSVTWNASRYPSIIVRHKQTHRVLGIGRKGELTVTTSSPGELEALLSDGVSSSTRALTLGGAP